MYDSALRAVNLLVLNKNVFLDLNSCFCRITFIFAVPTSTQRRIVVTNVRLIMRACS